MTLRNITHVDKVTKRKVNFFINYFDYATQNAKSLDTIAIETPLSIFENIKYQLEKNRDNSLNYLENYFKNPILQNYDFKTCKRLIARFKKEIEPLDTLNENSDKKNWISENSEILIGISDRIIINLKAKFFKEIVDTTIVMLRCKHGLEFHIFHFKELSNLIISDFLLNGFTQEDLKNIFKYILSKDIDKFPFDRSLFFKQEKRNWEKIRKDFMKKRTFTTQFLGIKNFRFKKRNSAKFLIKIYGLTLKENETYIFNNINIVSGNSPNLIKFKENDKLPMKLYFRDEDEFCIAIIEQKYRSLNYAIESVSEKLSHVIDKINSRSNYNCIANYKDFILTKDYDDFTVRVSKFVRLEPLSKGEVLKIKAPNLPLEGENPKTKSLYKFEHLYDKAVNSKHLSDYWVYLESIFRANIPKANSEKIISTMAYILTSNYIGQMEEDIKSSIWGGLMMNFKLYGFSDREYNQYRSYDRFPFNLVKENTKNDFVLNLFDLIESQKSKTHLNQMFDYYKNLILQLYEYRNQYLHTGIENTNIKIQLKYKIEKQIHRFRGFILNYLHEERFENLRSALESIINKTKSKLK